MFRMNFMEDILPAPIIVDILSRLPVKTIVHCKCVCRKWRSLISDPYFVKLQFPRSPSGLMIHHKHEERLALVNRPGFLKFFEIREEADHHALHHDPAMSLNLGLAAPFVDTDLLMAGSVNGLLCLWQYGDKNDNTYVCNPITREYLILPRQQYYREGYAIIVYGFGIGPLKGEFKVVRIFQGDIPPDGTSGKRPSLLEGEIYTLGTGKWRSLGHIPFWLNGFHGPFLNGFMHWIVLDHDSPEEICRFDVENEKFELFPSPPNAHKVIRFQILGTLGGCLSRCDTLEENGFIVIWVMKEYGIKKSWTKEIVIDTNIERSLEWLTWEPLDVLKVLKDGTVLMTYYEDKLLAYSHDSKSVEDTEILGRYFTGMSFVPSFIRLRDYEKETVNSF